MKMPTLKEILKNPTCLEKVELTEENQQIFCDYISDDNNYINSQPKLTEEIYLALPTNYRNLVKWPHLGVNFVSGPWIIKYETEEMFLEQVLQKYGLSCAEYLSSSNPNIKNIAKAGLGVDYCTWPIKFLNDDQKEELKEDILNSYKSYVKKLNSLDAHDPLKLNHIVVVLTDFLSNVPATISNYDEIAMVIGEYGTHFVAKYLPERVVNNLIGKHKNKDAKYYFNEDGVGFDILEANSEFLKTSKAKTSSLEIKEEFLKNKYIEYVSTKSIETSL